jgi:hypothetical protein
MSIMNFLNPAVEQVFGAYKPRNAAERIRAAAAGQGAVRAPR